MTDKIIIDGIDVNKCEFAEIFNNKCICNCIMATDCKRIPKKVINIYCEDNKFCDFKELARAKKENEKLRIQLMQKSEVNTFFNIPIKGWDNDTCKICTYKKNYQAKEQECEKYKKGFGEDFVFNNELINDKLQIGLERNRYKQALDEIAYQATELFLGIENKDRAYCEKILNIINRAKGE